MHHCFTAQISAYLANKSKLQDEVDPEARVNEVHDRVHDHNRLGRQMIF